MRRIPDVSWKSLPGPQDITRSVLPNGIILLTRSNFNSPSVVINGYLPSGSIFDPREKLGLAHFTALALMRGTHRRSFQQIYDALESVGASLGFGASVHNTSFGGRALAEDLPLLLSTLSEALREPAFPAEQIDRLRAQLLTGLAMRDQDTSDRASIRFDELLFPNHPYGLPEDGYPETIQAIQRNDILTHHQRVFGPRSMVLVIVGAVSASQVYDAVSQAFGSWDNPSQPAMPTLPPLIPLTTAVREHIALPGKSQTDLIMGGFGPKRSSPDYLAASLGNNILGQFGMMGRIGDVVREQAGLAYYASTSLNAWINTGSWEVSAGVNPANLQRAIDLILAEIQRFITEPVTLEELLDSQANYIGRLPLSMESNNGVAAALLNMERFQLGLDYYQQFPTQVRAITPEGVLLAAQRYLFPDRMIAISSGPDLQ
ncbi:insulinase family protein [bacterium]|nr:MAG: insulinase family protein [bacterium]